MPSSGPDRLTLVAYAAFVLIGGSVAVAIRLGSVELPAFWAAGLRYGIASVVLTGLAIAWRIPFPHGSTLLGPVLFALLFFGGSVPLTYLSLAQVPAGVSSLAGAFSPLVTLLLASAVGLERFTLRAVAGSLLAVMGVSAIVVQQLDASVPPLALAELVAANILGAASVVVLKRLPLSHPTTASAVVTAIGAPILLGLSLVARESWALNLGIGTWASFAFLVVGGTVVLFQLGYLIIQRWTATAFSYSNLLSPLATVAVAAIVLAEPIRLSTVAGGVLILGGVWLGAMSAPAMASPGPALAEV